MQIERSTGEVKNSVNNLLGDLKHFTQISNDLSSLQETEAVLISELSKFRPDIKPGPDSRTISDLKKPSKKTLNPERISNK